MSRYVVPWWSPDADGRPMGEPETYVLIGKDERIDGLHVREPFGKDTDATLSIHATRGNGNDGGTITLAITTVMQTTKRPTGRTFEPYMDVMQQGNPKGFRSQPDGYLDESNGANEPDED